MNERARGAVAAREAPTIVSAGSPVIGAAHAGRRTRLHVLGELGRSRASRARRSRGRRRPSAISTCIIGERERAVGARPHHAGARRPAARSACGTGRCTTTWAPRGARLLHERHHVDGRVGGVDAPQHHEVARRPSARSRCRSPRRRVARQPAYAVVDADRAVAAGSRRARGRAGGPRSTAPAPWCPRRRTAGSPRAPLLVDDRAPARRRSRRSPRPRRSARSRPRALGPDAPQRRR